ncbi:hypothetical protein [uncultured Amphritea sp.]|uniref:hypothetical protein n=1 Tax=uncultured Amphritea sp. TaxID=981605 RepID=UPI00262AD0D0|nr:hypothetical protein [uncultured Amphritea sp.]
MIVIVTIKEEITADVTVADKESQITRVDRNSTMNSCIAISISGCCQKQSGEGEQWQAEYFNQ